MNEESQKEANITQNTINKEETILSSVENKSLKAAHQGVVQLDENLLAEIKKIPSKMSFKIGEVADLLQIKPYVLRYWETEFDFFHPQKTENGQRLYFRKDVEVALLIKKLLYQDGFSIKGAKGVFQKLKKEHRTYHKKNVLQEQIIKELESMKKNISHLKKLID